MVREGLAALISHDPQIRVVGQCGDGMQVIEQIGALQPDVLVLDIAMPGMNGLDICRELTKKFPKTKVLILTMHYSEQFIAKAMQNGACGYMIKDTAPAQLIEAVLTVARGEMFLEPGIPQATLVPNTQGDGDPYDSLTKRERQVLQLIAEGKTNRQIAQVLKLSVKTIDIHRSQLMRKLGIHDKKSWAKYALREGVTQPHDNVLTLGMRREHAAQILVSSGSHLLLDMPSLREKMPRELYELPNGQWILLVTKRDVITGISVCCDVCMPEAERTWENVKTLTIRGKGK
jgi:DNA-binding NarL/FixJ family response regulator